MAEQVMDTRSVGAVIRRGWRWITAFAVAGAALGAVYVIEIPPQLSSTTVLLLPASSAGTDPNQQSSTETQVHIAGSIPVFARAAKAVKPALTVAEVQKRVTVDSSISNLIEIHASSPEASQAEALSQAVADAYLATLKDRLDSLSGVPPQFTLREAALNKQLRSVREQIAATTERLSSEAPTSSDGIRDAQLQAELVNDQTDVLVRLDKVKDAAQQASTSLVVLPTLWQRASPADAPSQVQRLITWSVIGALLAAATAALVLVLRTRRDPRVRARDDLADAVGSSLLAVVHGHPQRSVAGWLTLLETYEAPAEEAWAFRQVLRALVPPSDSREVSRIGARATAGPLEHPRSLSVLAFSSDQRAIAIGPQLAAFAASLGISTRFVVATKHDSVASLYAACASDRGSEVRPGLAVAAAAPDDASSEPGSARDTRALTSRPRARTSTEGHDGPTGAVDLTILFAVADRREPSLEGLAATAATMLAVSPGVATRQELARLAVAVDDTGRQIDGVVVAHQDPSDRTTGRRTLDQRAVQAPLPIRMTGSGQVAPPRRRGSTAQ